MKKVCSWCKSHMGETLTTSAHGSTISHGICAPCLEQLMFEDDLLSEPSIQNLDVAAFLIRNDGRIEAANRVATQTLDRPLVEIIGKLGGDAFGCIHASEINGCGATIHCESCTIRSSFTQTFETGEKITAIAYPDLEINKDAPAPTFYISTEKKDNLVLLCITDIK